jgi:hypothetical protein
MKNEPTALNAAAFFNIGHIVTHTFFISENAAAGLLRFSYGKNMN